MTDRNELGADGTAHVTYYDAEHQLSFVWDGLRLNIAVSHGGYGEKVVQLIPMEPTGGKVDLAAFERVCQRWTNEWVRAG